MKFKGSHITQASGSLAGVTYSHNRGGQYTRARAIPVDPGSPYQVEVRNYVSALTSAWGSLLTQAQRTAWDTYAELVPLLDSLGDPRNAGGIAHYVRSNVPRLQAGLSQQDDAPTIYDLGEYTAPTIESATAPDQVSVGFNPSDAWANETGSAMLLYGSRGQNPSINFFKGPYRFAGPIAGDDTTPPTSPTVITNPFTLTDGQRLFLQGRVSRADGRLSSPFRLFSAVG